MLADERGEVGERYILGNRNFTLDRLFADLGRLSGVEPPAVKLPLAAALALARAIEAAPGRPLITTGEIRASSLWWAFRSTKAKRELRWTPSHHEDTLVRTIEWYRREEPLRLVAPGARQPLALRAAGFGLRTTGGVVARLRPWSGRQAGSSSASASSRSAPVAIPRNAGSNENSTRAPVAGALVDDRRRPRRCAEAGRPRPRRARARPARGGRRRPAPRVAGPGRRHPGRRRAGRRARTPSRPEVDGDGGARDAQARARDGARPRS